MYLVVCQVCFDGNRYLKFGVRSSEFGVRSSELQPNPHFNVDTVLD